MSFRLIGFVFRTPACADCGGCEGDLLLSPHHPWTMTGWGSRCQGKSHTSYVSVARSKGVQCPKSVEVRVLEARRAPCDCWPPRWSACVTDSDPGARSGIPRR